MGGGKDAQRKSSHHCLLACWSNTPSVRQADAPFSSRPWELRRGGVICLRNHQWRKHNSEGETGYNSKITHYPCNLQHWDHLLEFFNGIAERETISTSVSSIS